MKTKNEYLKEQGIDLEKDFSVGTYTKIRFAMEKYAEDYHESEVKKFRLAAVVGRSEQLVCVHPYDEVYQSETECYCEKCGKDLTNAN